MNHQINREDFRQWNKKPHFVKYASQFGGRVNKELGVDTNGNFVVFKNGRKVLTSTNIDDAVNKYNNL
jgi:hypothetical protein